MSLRVDTDDYPEDPEYLRILSRALELQEEGTEVDLEGLCVERPELLAAVREGLQSVERLPTLQRASVGFDDLIGRLLAERYRLDERIGAGSMGVVYRATDVELQRRVAVKLLRADHLRAPSARARFVREAEVLAAVRHEAVVTVFDRGETDDGTMFVVMELLEGRALDDLLEEVTAMPEALERVSKHDRTVAFTKAFDPAAALEPSFLRQSVRWCLELARGLGAAHAAGVVHRDVKPSNVFLRSDGRAVLLDFGIATREADWTLAEDVDATVGTPAYMAPERLQDEEVTPVVDIYGLSATLYHLITLRAPYRGTPSEVLSRLAKRDPLPALALRPNLPRDLQAILDKGMSRSPASRYPTAAAFADDLERFLEFRPIAARPVSALRRFARSAWRQREVRVVACLLVVACLGLLGRSWYESRVAARATAWEQVRRAVPPSLVNCGTRSREVQDASLRDGVAVKLDRLVELADSAVPSRVLRGCFRLDHGDPAGAAADFSQVARELGTEYSVALASAYARLQPDARGAENLDLSVMPTAREKSDLYLETLHQMRRPDFSDPIALLESVPETRLLDRSAAHFAEVVLLLRAQHARRKSPGAERAAEYRRIHESAIRLEEALGQESAGTLVARGTALLGERRPDEAAVLLRRALELTPSDHVARMNLGVALRVSGDPDGACREFETVLALRPSSKGGHRNLARARLDAGRFEEAEAGVHAANFDETTGDRPYLLGKIAFARSVATIHSGDVETGRRIALESQRWFEEAASVAPHRGREYDAIVSRWIAESGERDVAVDLIQVTEAAPMRWRRVFSLASTLPGDLDAEQTAAMRQFLFALARALDPEAFDRLSRPSESSSLSNSK